MGISVIKPRPYSWEENSGLSEPTCAWSKGQVLTWSLTSGISLNSSVCPKIWWIVRDNSQASPCSQERHQHLREWFILHHWEMLSHMLNCPLCLQEEAGHTIFRKKVSGDKRSQQKSSARNTYSVGDKLKAVYNYWKIHSNLLRNFISTMFSVNPLPKMYMHFEKMLWKKLCNDVVCLAWGREKYGIGKL